ncbi:MAG: hypothetical protein ACYC5Y_11310 [Symbiobacteriia bacterium]
MKTARLVAAAFMALSAATHLVQLVVMHFAPDVLVAGLGFGLIYTIIAIGLFADRKAFYYAGAILPAVGGVLGLLRYFLVRPNGFSLFNVALDLVVVPACIYLIRQTRRQGSLSA